MKVTFNRSKLLECLKSMIRVVPNTSAVMELVGFLIECDDEGFAKITATNLETTVQRRFKANVESDGSIVVAAAMFFKMVSLLGGDTVTVDETGRGRISVQSNKCTYTIPALSSKNYPKVNMPFPDDTLKIKGICSLYAKTAQAVADEKLSASLSGVRLELYSDAVRAIGCDTFRMSIMNVGCDCGGKMSVTIPKQAFSLLVNAVSDVDELQVGICGNNVVFMKEGMLFSTKLINEKYLDVDRLTDSALRTEVAIIKADDLRSIGDTIAPIISSGGDIAPIEIKFNKNSISVKAESQYASGGLSVSAQVNNMAGETFYYPYKAIMDALRVVKGDVKIEMTKHGMMYLSNKTGMYMIVNTRKRSVKKQQSAKSKGKAKVA